MFFGKKDKDVRLTDKQYKDLVGGMSKKERKSLTVARSSSVETGKMTGLMRGLTSKMRWMGCEEMHVC